jgi:amino acid adenylation domain-containing protein/non-ribosomal peptide synthase protein (TIGR01720 family)
MSQKSETMIAVASDELDALERLVEAELGLLEPGSVRLFGLKDELLRGAELGVLAQVAPSLRALLSLDALAATLSEVVEQRWGAAPGAIVLCDAQPPSLRAESTRRWRSGTLQGFATYRAGRRVPEPASGVAVDSSASAHRTELELIQIWREVLQISVVPRDSTFFALGGSSLRAAQLALRVRQHFCVALEPRQLFETPTPEALAAAIDERLRQGPAPVDAIVRVPLDAPLRLAPAQQRMHLAWQLDPLGSAYNICGALRLRGELDVTALEHALDALAARHSALRTHFPLLEGTAYQHIAPPGGRVDFRLEAHEADGGDWLRAQAAMPFDLERGPLFRVRLLELRAQAYVLAATLHHSIADGASMNVLLAELAELYAARAAQRAPELEPLPVDFVDYAAWQAARLDAGEGERQLRYWREQLATSPPLLVLASDRPRPVRQSFRGATQHFELPPALADSVRALARRHDASAFAVLHAAYVLLLSAHGAEQDVCVGVLAANRVRLEAQGLIGPCVNTLALRSRLRPSETFEELLSRTQRAVVGAQMNQELPFEQLVEALAPERSAAHHPLFQAMHNHQQRQVKALAAWPGLEVELLHVEHAVARFDLSLNTLEDEAGQLSASLVYATDLFDAARILRFAEHYCRLLQAVVERPGCPLGTLDWLPPAERAQIERSSLPERAPLSSEPGLLAPRAFFVSARRQPDARALVYGDCSLSYAALARRVCLLARELSARGAGPDVVVGVAVPRSLEQVISVLAVFAAGAAYLPLDPENPAARLAYLIQDSGARIVIVNGAVGGALLDVPGLTLLELQQIGLNSTALDERASPEGSLAELAGLSALRAQHLAYVMYTSGSTGRPKAVANTHGALRERLAWMQQEYGLTSRETLLHKTPATFDVAIWEVLWPMLAGATLAIAAPGDQRDPRELARLTQRHQVSTLHFVPSLLREVLALPELSECSSLRRLFSGGEALGADLRERVFERLPGVRLDNRYGPTEALINVSHWTCQPGQTGPVPIGRPLPGNELRILDPSLRQAPLGVPGELYIGGTALARGYVGAPGLTAERFVPDPFSATPGQRLYRSGDFARFGRDGAIEYLGRKDDQVKIRGVRVELGELEAALRELPGVQAAAAAVQAGPGGLSQLLGYVVLDATHAGESLEALLAQRLPSALLPSVLVRCASLPLLDSGKLDRKALPAVEAQQSAFSPPESALEWRLAELWAEVLQVERVGRGEDFFALGGHSLLATRVVARVRQAFELDLPLRELFEAPELGAFARRVQARLDAGRGAYVSAIPVQDRARPLPLSPSQERMWFAWRLDPDSAAYNVAGAVELTGELDVAALSRALQTLIERHEALRTTFPDQAGAPLQHIAEGASVALEQVDLSGLPEAERELEWPRLARQDAHRPFDLHAGPLFRAKLLCLTPRRHVVLVTLHHIIAEGWGMDVFAREWTALYAAYRSGAASALPPLSVQYADYAAWQRQWLGSAECERQIEYWKRTLGTEHPVLDLPSDRPRPALQSFRGDYHRFVLDAELSRRVREACVQHGVTLPMLMLAAFSAFIYRYTGQSDVRVGVPIAGRTRPELEALIGAFLNIQVLRCQISSKLTGRELMARVKRASIDAQSHQDVPFQHVVDAVHPERSAAHLPLFQVMCNVQRWGFQQTRDVAGLRLEFLPNDARAAKCDLSLDVSEVQERLECAFVYSTDLFDASSVERLARHWVSLLESLLDRPDASLGELPLLSAAERSRQLAIWNDSHCRMVFDARPVHELLLQRLTERPDSVAVVCEGRRLSAGGLLEHSGRLATRLQGLGVGPEVRVGIYLERSVEVLVAFLAVLRAGGAFVPLDSRLPAARLEDMARQAGLRLLITHSGLRATSDGRAAVEIAPETQRVCVDDPALMLEADTPRAVALHSEHLAYILYTSGSTGRPKGVAVPHGSFSMHCQAVGEIYALDASDTALSLAALGFDAFLEQTFVPLLSGARVIVDGPTHEDTRALHALVAGERVSLIYPPTSRIVELAAEARRAGQALWVRRCCVGGEAVTRTELERIQEGLGCAVTNGYGPTETVVTPLLWRSDDQQPFRGGVVPIGRAVGRRSLYVLDERLELAATGVTGELYIGAGGLARGYAGQPGLTAERFLPDPFGEPGGRVYRTGDLVRDPGDGCIEFLGRRDGQIKLRGHRIELGELEAQLAAHPAVEAAAVVVRSAAERGLVRPRLVAYVAARSAPPGLIEALQLALRQRFPEYMLPSRLVLLSALPRTPNGKVDARALPAPEEAVSVHLAPSGQVEGVLAELWQQLLAVERVGRDDNFFDLGGDSIIALQFVSRAREQSLQLTPRDVFQHQTLRALAQAARPMAERAAQIADADADSAGPVPLTPIQARFFAAPRSRPDHYNQAVLLEARQPLDATLLERALNVLRREHAALGFRYAQDEHGAWQQRSSPVELAATAASGAELWLRNAATEAELQGVNAEAQRSLSLHEGPLFRAVLIERGAGRQQLLLVIHHLVVDGVSWRVLLSDLQAAYRDLQASRPLSLPAHTSSFRRWAEQLAQHAHSPQLERELEYWVEQATRAGSDARLPADHSLLASDAQGLGVACSRLTPEATSQLLRHAPAAYRTQVNDLLLAALGPVLCNWTGQPSIGLELEGHGREECFEGVSPSRTVGWFTSLFPVCLTLARGHAAGDRASRIRAVKELLGKLPNKGLGYGVLRYLGRDPARARLASIPRPKISFNYLGQVDAGAAASDLLALAGDISGDNRAAEGPLEHELSIDARVEAGQLTLRWTYERRLFQPETIERLAGDYARELEAVTEHCVAQGVGAATPSDFPLLRLEQAELDGLMLALPGRDAALGNIQDIYPATALQQGLLFHTLYAGASETYVSQLSADLDQLDVERFSLAWQAASARHAILRTGFAQLEQTSAWVQVVRQQSRVRLREIDASGASEAELERHAAEERAAGFDLSRPPLQRLLLVRTAPHRHRLIWTHHHVLMDGWSSARLIGEVLDSYAGQTSAPPTADFRAYVQWLGRRDTAAEERFWRAELARLEQPTYLCAALVAPPSGQGFQSHVWSLANERYAELQAFARRHRLTLNTLVQGAWLFVLQRSTRHTAVAVGVTVAGRPVDLPGVESALGLFINTLPLIANPLPSRSALAWLCELQTQQLALGEHEHVALSDLQRWSGRAGQPLFDSLLVFENYPLDTELQARGGQGLHISRVRSLDRSHYALTIEVMARSSLRFAFKYDSARLSLEQIQAFSAQLEHVLDELVQKPGAALGALALSPDRAETRPWAEPAAAAKGLSLHGAIAARASEQPHAVALVQGNASLSFGELERRANQLAWRLRAQGVGPDVLVGVCARRSFELVIGLLAILKAGGAYVPFDPAYPDERLRYLIADSGVRLVLSESLFASRLAPLGAQLWCLDAADISNAAQPGAVPDGLTAPPSRTEPAHLVYCIYTSGSTGKPKGVAITHAGLDNYLRWAAEAYRLSELEGSVLHSSIGFDLSVTSLWVPLWAGKRVELAADGDDALAALAACLTRARGIDLLKLTPSHGRALAELLGTPLPGVRALIVGGEALDSDCVAALDSWAPAARIVNEYGPTEAVVGCCVCDVALGDGAAPGASLPIGMPIHGAELYVVDAAFQRVPDGVAGELCIGGRGLARGYLNRAALTAERFVPHPFGGIGERLYRTGDLVRKRPGLAFEYLGRLDQQIKLRGHRIELGEIESRLREHPAVEDAAVALRETPSSRQLVAYVVLDPLEAAALGSPDAGAADAGAAWQRTLLQHLGTALPEHMLPAHITFLSQLPLTSNGKLDRNALPDPDWSGRMYVAPEGDVEQRLAEIWAQVLRVERVGRSDNFFDLGGDSIVSLQVVTRARRLGFEIVPRDVFEHQTIAELARSAAARRAETPPDSPGQAAADGQSEPAANLLQKPGPAAPAALVSEQLAALGLALEDVESIYAVSPVQRGVLFHALHDPEPGVYVSQLRARARDLDVSRFASAWREVILKREIMRTGFVSDEERGVIQQVVFRSAPLPLEELDFRGRELTRPQLDELAQNERLRGFDLAQPPLQRVLLLRVGEAEHQLIWTHHHALVDGWSNARLLEDVLGFYESGQLPDRPGKYSNYLAWLSQRAPLPSELYWKERMALLDEPTLLGAVLGGQASSSGHEQLTIELSQGLSDDLRTFARRERITLNTLIQAAWLLLLGHYTGQRSVVFGATVSGRPAGITDVESMLGLFINTLPVVARLSPGQKLADFLRELQAANLGLREHEHVPLADVQRWSDRRGRDLFDTVLVFENYPLSQVLGGGGVQLQFDDIEVANPTNHGMTIQVFPETRLRLSYGYWRERFDPARVRTLSDQLTQLLMDMRALPEQKLGALGVSGAFDGNAQAPLVGPSKTQAWVSVHESFERAAQLAPDATAIVCGIEVLSYAALDARANRLAERLREHGVGRGAVVGLCVPRSLAMAVGALGILKAGAAYLPLDAGQPEERLAQLVEDGGISLLLCERAQAPLPVSVSCWGVDAGEPLAADESRPLPACSLHPQDLAYCIYTSGSTGKPKAAENTHGALSNRIRWMQDEYRLSPADRVLQKAPFGFDIAVSELLWPLACGAQLVMAPPGAQRDPTEVSAAMLRHSITVIDFVSSLLGALVESGQFQDCSSLRLVTTGAEALPAEVARRFVAQHGARLVNEYGPTEAAIATTHWDCSAHEQDGIVPIGRPIANTTLHILDEFLNESSSLARGELYISGAALARGYRSRPAQTAERFVPDPFAKQPGQRMYRTGDRARRRPEGVVEFLGRVDEQVKIRGYRIELGEIETQLRAQEQVADAVVVARASQRGKQLVGYVVGSRGAEPPEPRLLCDRLRACLPDYMVPAQIVVLGALPRNRNGKLDRKALPEPKWQEHEAAAAPRSAVELQLAQIWREVLGVPQVGIEDNFFELGGDSIVTLQIARRARERGLELVPKDIFMHQTLGALAKLVEQRAAPALDNCLVIGSVPLAPAQAQWLEAARADARGLGGWLALRAEHGWDADVLRRAIERLVEQHDLLRATFERAASGSWQQSHMPLEALREHWRTQPLLWLRSGAGERALRAVVSEAERSLLLGHGPLFRCVLLDGGAQGQQLILVAHPLVVDERSWQILLEDLQSLYAQLAESRRVTLSAKTTSFKAWVEQLHGFVQAGRADPELPFWLMQAGEARRTAVASTNDDGPARHARISLRLNTQKTRALFGPALAAYRVQPLDLLLTALARALAEFQSDASVLVELDTDGRVYLPDSADLSRTVGSFRSRFPLRLTVERGVHAGALGASIKMLKEQLRGAPRGGFGHAALEQLSAVATQDRLRALGRPRVSFSFAGSLPEPVAPSSSWDVTAGVRCPRPPLSPHADCWLAFETRLSEGRLRLCCRYRADVYHRDAMRALLQDFARQLGLVLQHCVEDGAIGLTPSDVLGGAAAQEDIDAVLTALAES